MSTIALVLYAYFPHGGLQRNCLAVAQALASRGHDVHVFTGKWQGERLQGVRVYELPPSGFTRSQQNARFTKAWQAAVSALGVDLVVGFNKMPGLDLYYCADACFAAKAYEQRGWWYRKTQRARQLLDYEAAVFCPESQTEILLLSAREGAAYQQYYQTHAARLHPIPPGIGRGYVRNAQSAVRGAAIRRSLAIDTDQWVICFVGSYFKTKGLDRLLSAVRGLPPPFKNATQVLVLGQDKNSSEFQRQAEQLGIGEQIHFLGYREDVADCLFASDVLVHPARQENTGNVILEAAVAGLPVICSGICGYAEYVREHRLGVVLDEPFELEALERALLNVLSDKTTNWAQRCVEFASSADIYSRVERIVEKVEALAAERAANERA